MEVKFLTFAFASYFFSLLASSLSRFCPYIHKFGVTDVETLELIITEITNELCTLKVA